MRRLTLLLTLLFLCVALPVVAQDESASSPPAADAAPDLAPAEAEPETAAAPETPAPRKPVEITDEAQGIWEKYGDAIYQVQVIDLASDKKNSIGSGFQFTKDGMMATNYHVVSEA
ncbi:MAG TPA: hypothetical protein VEF76_10100, partial [Patescibacteria group bacterium]|nr:hypothetical protein [Patescibacteria group bacterium]